MCQQVLIIDVRWVIGRRDEDNCLELLSEEQGARVGSVRDALVVIELSEQRITIKEPADIFDIRSIQDK